MMDKKEIAKSIYNHFYAIADLVKQMSEKDRLHFSGCIIQQNQNQGDYISFFVGRADTYEDILSYHNIVAKEETEETLDIGYAKLFTEDNVE